METRSIKIKSKSSGKMSITIIPGHFATNHSHVNYYIDITGVNHHSKAAHLAAAELAAKYANSTPVDTIICMDGCEMVGGFMAQELSQTGIGSLSGENDICVLTPEHNATGQMVFRDNIQSMVWNKNILLLIASATTGKTIHRSLECIQYYGGKAVGICAVFSAIAERSGLPVHSVFSLADLPDYETYAPRDCPLCKNHTKIDAIVNSSGYTKL